MKMHNHSLFHQNISAHIDFQATGKSQEAMQYLIYPDQSIESKRRLTRLTLERTQRESQQTKKRSCAKSNKHGNSAELSDLREMNPNTDDNRVCTKTVLQMLFKVLPTPWCEMPSPMYDVTSKQSALLSPN